MERALLSFSIFAEIGWSPDRAWRVVLPLILSLHWQEVQAQRVDPSVTRLVGVQVLRVFCLWQSLCGLQLPQLLQQRGERGHPARSRGGHLGAEPQRLPTQDCPKP
jgi:hypothetical protein